MRSRSPQISGLILDTDRGQHAVAVVVPVLIDGELRHGLGAWVPWAAWQGVLQSATPTGPAYSTLFDADRRVIARSAEPERFVWQGAAAMPLENEEHRRMADARDRGWRVAGAWA